MYSTWQDGRKPSGELKTGEKVQGLTGVYITRQPDRFLVMQPIPSLSLKTGDVLLQYGEWGEGAADLWAAGQWHKDFDWGQTTEDGQQVLAEENLTLIRHGVKEWWVQVKRADGLTGWVLADGNFGHMDQLGDGPDDSPSTSDANPGSEQQPAKTPDVPEPLLPVINPYACLTNGRVIARWTVQSGAPYYRFDGKDWWQLGILEVGQQVNIVDGAEVIGKPDRILVTQPIPDLGVQPDDIVLRYGPYRKGKSNIWAKGEWHEYSGLATVEKDGSGCHARCDSVVFQKGIIERWVEIRTSTANTGWVMAYRSTNDETWDSGDFGNLCPN